MKKLILLAMFVVVGLAMALPQPRPTYILDQYNKSVCMYGVGWDMAETIDCSFTTCCNPDGSCPGSYVGVQINDAMEDLDGAFDARDYASVLQDYAVMVSLFNQMSGVYLQYGIDYVLDLGEEGSMGELMGSFASYHGELLGCFAGEGDGDEVNVTVVTAYGS